MQNLNATPDLVLINGTVLTIAPQNSVASAVAVTAGLITAVGTDAGVLSLRGPKTRVIDLRGQADAVCAPPPQPSTAAYTSSTSCVRSGSWKFSAR